MRSFDLNNIIRENIKKLIPYSSARSEYEGDASIFLDANENSMGSTIKTGYNRYPDPLQQQLKERISAIKNVPAANIFIGNGSDEAIDLLIRATCNPGKDNIIICPPTYGMYEVAAQINDVQVKKVLLTNNFQLDTAGIINAIDDTTRLIFVCSPNNPTGNLIERTTIEKLLENFNGLVVVDEAYIDFAENDTWLQFLDKNPNLIVLQTLSKAWGLAGLRVGIAFASTEMIEVLNKIKAPYNVNISSQELALTALNNVDTIQQWVSIIKEQRVWVEEELQNMSIIKKLYPSDANFILIEVTSANELYNYLLKQNIVVRNRHNIPLCSNCLRITVGTPEENKQLLNALKQYSNE